MSYTKARAWATPKSTGEKLEASEANSLDDAGWYAWNRDGTTAIIGASTVDLAGTTLGFDATDTGSAIGFFLGASDATISLAGAGLWNFSDASKVKFSGTGWPNLGSRTAYRSLNAPAVFSEWDWVNADLCYRQPAADKSLMFPLHQLIDGATLTGVTVRLKGDTNAGGFSALPATMPSVKVYKRATDGTLSQIGSTATDASGTVGAFNAAHNVTVSDLSEVVDQSGGKTYFVEVIGAGGANYVTDELEVVAMYAAYTVTFLTSG